MLTICGFVIITLLWSFFGRLDIVAVARGKMQTAGRIKIVQPVEAGRVVLIVREQRLDREGGGSAC